MNSKIKTDESEEPRDLGKIKVFEKPTAEGRHEKIYGEVVGGTGNNFILKPLQGEPVTAPWSLTRDVQPGEISEYERQKKMAPAK